MEEYRKILSKIMSFDDKKLDQVFEEQDSILLQLQANRMILEEDKRDFDIVSKQIDDKEESLAGLEKQTEYYARSNTVDRKTQAEIERISKKLDELRSTYAALAKHITFLENEYLELTSKLYELHKSIEEEVKALRFALGAYIDYGNLSEASEYVDTAEPEEYVSQEGFPKPTQLVFNLDDIGQPRITDLDSQSQQTQQILK